uniref:Uncharacterized protein n=1 Tax=Anguilla anguilla TaxID=7936 RepID=A0A0E9VYD4_ANGAN
MTVDDFKKNWHASRQPQEELLTTIVIQKIFTGGKRVVETSATLVPASLNEF